MNSLQPLPDELQQLLQAQETPRPKGRRHRRHEKDTYQSYPAIINQSFEFQQPTTPVATFPIARRPRVVAQRPEAAAAAASRPVSVFATVGSRPTSVASNQAVVAEAPTAIVTQPPASPSDPPTLLSAPTPATARVADPPVVMVYPVHEATHKPAAKSVKIVEPPRPTKPVSHAIVDEYEDDLTCPICMNVM